MVCRMEQDGGRIFPERTVNIEQKYRSFQQLKAPAASSEVANCKQRITPPLSFKSTKAANTALRSCHIFASLPKEITYSIHEPRSVEQLSISGYCINNMVNSMQGDLWCMYGR